MNPSYDLKPGVAVGPFQLGDSLWAILELLRTRKNEYPKVDISWDDSAPHTSAVVIHIPHISLYFPCSPTQHLALIRLPDINLSSATSSASLGIHRRNLTYDNGKQVLSSRTHTLTRGVVGRVLGPTYAAQGASLDYPGISFTLATSEGAGRSGRDDVVQSLDVKPKQEDGSGSRLWKGIRSCQVLAGKGIAIDLPTGEKLDITFEGTTSQDILLDLGSPIRKYWKEDDRMARTWGSEDVAMMDDTDGDCFWNYFQHGIDFLISRSGHLKRIILHSNIPGTPLFQRYARCPWTIETPSGSFGMISKASEIASALSRGDIPLESPSPYLAPPLPSSTPEPTSETDPPTVPANGTSKKKKKKGVPQPGSSVSQSPAHLEVDNALHASPSPSPSPSPAPVVTSGKVAQIDEEGLSVEAGKGMMLDRIGEGGMDGVQGDMTSRLIGLQGLIMEEDIATGALTAVTVYAT